MARLRWFQVSLRDILAMVAICSILLAWWNDRKGLATAAQEAEAQRAEVLRLQEELIAAHAAPPADASALGVGGCRIDIPPVYGLVVGTKPEKEAVEINIGSDDGLKVGDSLEVFRFGDTLSSTAYLGKIRLISVATTKAIGKILHTKGTIDVNDHVATRLE